MLLPLDNRPYALKPLITLFDKIFAAPLLGNRHGISRLPQVEAGKRMHKIFKR